MSSSKCKSRIREGAGLVEGKARCNSLVIQELGTRNLKVINSHGTLMCKYFRCVSEILSLQGLASYVIIYLLIHLSPAMFLIIISNVIANYHLQTRYGRRHMVRRRTAELCPNLCFPDTAQSYVDDAAGRGARSF